MTRYSSNWLNHELLLMPGFFFEGGDPPPADPPADPPAGDPKTFDEAYVKTLRAEAAANRKKAAELEARLKEKEDADLSELEKAKKAATEATEKLAAGEKTARERIARAAVLTAATTANIVDPDAAFKLISDEIQFDADGEPTNVSDLITKLATDKPYLVGGGGGGGNPANPGGGRGSQLTLDGIKKLAESNPDEFNRRFDKGEFDAVLKGR